MTKKKFQKEDEKPCDLIEEALLKRALGFRQDEEQSEDIIDKKTGEVLETVRRKRVSKDVLPDVRALLFWLKNRRPERWKDHQSEADESASYEFDDTEQSL